MLTDFFDQPTTGRRKRDITNKKNPNIEQTHPNIEKTKRKHRKQNTQNRKQNEQIYILTKNKIHPYKNDRKPSQVYIHYATLI